MNIYLQSAGIFVMIVIFIFYFIDRKAAVRSNRIFFYQGLAIFLSLFMDILSIILINIDPDALITMIVCKMYLPTTFLVSFFGLLYVLTDIQFTSKKNMKPLMIASVLLLLIGIVLISVFPLEITVNEAGNALNDYTSGMPVVFTYVFAFGFIAITLALTIINRKIIYKKRVWAVFIFTGVWVFGSLVQFVFNYVLTDLGVIVLSVSFGETLGAMVIYIMLENPSLNIDKVTGALNQRAFTEYIDECLDKKKNAEFFLIDYDTAIVSNACGLNEFASALAKMLGKFHAGRIFKSDRNKFVVVRNENETRKLSDTIVDFKTQLYKELNINFEIPFKIIYFTNIFLFKNVKEITDAIEYLDSNIKRFDCDLLEVTSEVADEIHKKFMMDEQCDIAFNQKNIEVFYQPLYSTNLESFTSAEALVRMRGADGSIINPGDFIETMEKDGRILELGQMVFENVCRFIKENDMEALGLHYIEVNLSTVQCMQEDLAQKFIDIMEKYKVDPRYINLEITETGQMSKKTLLKNMETLKYYGVTFSLDDFGTGNSNLNYIIEMPVNIVKFDRTMVQSYFENKIASYVMDSTIDMIKGLGHKIVFEGIETEEQVRVVKILDVDYIQGYYYSKPIDEEAFIEFLKKNNK